MCREWAVELETELVGKGLRDLYNLRAYTLANDYVEIQGQWNITF